MVVPIISIIPGLIRLFTFFGWITFAFCHTLFKRRINRPAYFYIFGLYVATGFFACTIAPINFVFYALRNNEVLIKSTDKIDGDDIVSSHSKYTVKHEDISTTANVNNDVVVDN